MFNLRMRAPAFAGILLRQLQVAQAVSLIRLVSPEIPVSEDLVLLHHPYLPLGHTGQAPREVLYP